MAVSFEPVDTFEFREPLTGEQCVVVVRAGASGVALALSRREAGDAEVILPPAEVDRLMKALTTGLHSTV